MLLSSLEVRNFRSLEHIKLNKLSQFNVFIGRNNAGKSTILSALQFLATRVFGLGGSLDVQNQVSILTAHDLARELWYRLEFEPSSDERQRFVRLMVDAGYNEERGEHVLNSPFLRHVFYEFVAPAGQPSQIQLSRACIRTGDNKWTNVLDRNQEEIGSSANYLTPQLFHPQHICQLGDLTLEGLDNAVNSGGRMGLRIDLGTFQVPTNIPEINLWLVPQLVEYFANGYFFSPFRHSSEHLFASPRMTLAPDGSNLPVVLNYLSGKSRRRFKRVEDFLQEAVPGVGMLHPGLVESAEQGVPGPQPVEITFESADGYNVSLRNMGGGVEQLLMVATTLATVEERATLFLEEPELHLHAGAQRYLIERLRADSRQVFITTHSPVFMNLRPPRSLYRVRADNARTTVDRIADASALAELMQDIGARNSDLLISDAVLFVEGPSDREIIHHWAHALDMSLEGYNVSVLPMGGGRNAEQQASARSDVLVGISQKAPVPHLFLLDKDERGRSTMDNLKQRLGDSLHLLDRREIENYLLVPRAILAALQSKYRDTSPVLKRVQAGSSADVERLIHEAAGGLYGLVFLKRIRAEIGGLRDGLVPGEMVGQFATRAHESEFPALIREAIETRIDSVISGLDLDALVQAEREALDVEWSDPDRRLALAPGEEILGLVFKHFGGEFNKRTDGPRIAAEMSANEITPEITALIERLAELSNQVILKEASCQ